LLRCEAEKSVEANLTHLVRVRAITLPDSNRYLGRDQQEEGNMKITSLIAALVVTAALTAFSQEGVVQDVKHGAKKAGETIKEGVETAAEKTKDAAKTVGKKTKETAETVGEKTKETGETVARKTKETVNGTGERATGSTRTTRHKSRNAASKAKAQTTEEQTTGRDSNTPAPSPTP